MELFTMEFFTWEMLLTLGGASVATGLMTQMLKKHIPIATQILSYGIAFLILLAATVFTGGKDPAQFTMCLINAVIVSGAASNTASFVNRMKGSD